MLASVHLAEGLASVVTMTGFELFVDLVELWALETVEENTAKGFVEVFFDSGDDLFKNVRLRRPWSPVDGF